MTWFTCRGSWPVNEESGSTRGASRWAVVGVGILLAIAGGRTANAADGSARESYSAQEFDKSIEACRGRTDHEGMVIRALAYAEKYALYKQKEDKKELAALAKSLKDVLGAKDLVMLAGLGTISANPNGVDFAADLMDGILDKVGTLEDMDAVLKIIQLSPGPKATASALKALQRHLAQVRKYVDAGGTMPEGERRLFSRRDLADTLVPLLDEKTARASAQKSLILIEEPALAALEEQSGATALEAAGKIRDAVADRQNKRPGSAWYGAPDAQ
jgi:hypothetical protein